MAEKNNENKYRLNFDEVRKYLPHRYPFLLVDRVLEIHPMGDITKEEDVKKPGTRVVALKNFTGNEAFYPGHFPEMSVTPGVILIEAMAQVACFTLYPYFDGDKGKLAREYVVSLVGTDGIRFRKPVVPGDTVIFEATVKKVRGTLFMYDVVGRVDGQEVCGGEILANLSLKGAKS